jgi:hypothetical protein
MSSSTKGAGKTGYPHTTVSNPILKLIHSASKTYLKNLRL